jgi:hypothetical protein
MWEPRRLTTLWAFTACYRDSFTIFFTFYSGQLGQNLTGPYICCRPDIKINALSLPPGIEAGTPVRRYNIHLLRYTTAIGQQRDMCPCWMEKRLSISTESRSGDPGKSGLLFVNSHVNLPHPVGCICHLLSALDVSNQQSKLFAGNINKYENNWFQG